MNFDNLFDFETTKIRKLFFILQANPSAYSLAQLADDLDLNRKTVLKYLKKLQELFIEYKLSNHLSIVRIGRDTVSLHSNSDVYGMKFTIYFLSNTIEIQLLLLSLESKILSFRIIAERIGVSEPLLRNRLSKLNRWLESYALRLERKTHKLVGNENQIREFLFQFYQCLPSGVAKQKVRLHDETFLLANEILSFFEIKANAIQKALILELLNVTIDRYKKGYPINFQKKWQKYTIDSPLLDTFLLKMPRNVISSNELIYLFLTIQVKFSFLFSKTKQAQIIQDHFLRKTSCFEHTLMVAKRMKYFFPEEQIEYDKPAMLSYLNFHLYYELVESFHFESIDDIPNLYKLYPKFINILEEAVVDLQKKSPFFSGIEANILINRYFRSLTSVISPVAYENKKYICLLTEFSPEKELDLEQQLTTFFHNKINIRVFCGRKSYSSFYADVILATNICQKMVEDTRQPILLIDGTKLTQEELFQIEKILKK